MRRFVDSKGLGFRVRVWCVGVQFALCVIAAVVYASKNQHLSDNAWYLDTQWESGISNFLSSLGVVSFQVSMFKV